MAMYTKQHNLFSPKSLGNHVIQLCQTKENLEFLKTKNSHLCFIEMEQPHLSDYAIIDGNIKSNTTKPNVDALITNRNNTALVVRSADCLPILISCSIGMLAIHAGRKSTQLGITKKICDYLNKSNAEQIDIFFGPHICKNCYEIDKKKSIFYDLANKNKKQLSIRYNTLQESSICTCCNTNKTFYSHRRGDTNRFYSIISKSTLIFR